MTATVVTGLGIAAPTGLGLDAYWKASLEGRGGIAEISHFDISSYPARLAGEIHGFEAAEYLSRKLLAQTDRMTRVALVSADWAFTDAGIDPAVEPDYELGVITASHAGGFEFGQNELNALWRKGGQYVSAYQSFAWFYAVNSGQISIRNNMRGPSGVVVSDQAGGLDAVGQARRLVRKGTPVVMSGAVDASLCPWGWVAQLANGGLSTRDQPDRAYLPFDDDACGYVPGEGGALLVLEEGERAARRGARVYGEIAGYAATVDPRPGTGRPPGLRRTIELALADARVAPADVDVVFADAAGLPEPDRIEVEALVAVFGVRGVPVTAPKTMTGRLYSGAAPLDLAAALLSIRDGVIPPTVNTRLSVRYPIDLVLETPREAPVRTALVLARGHGGFNSAVLVRATDGT